MDWNPAIRAAGWALLFLLFSGLCYGQSSVPRRISGPVNDAELTRLSGSIHPQTRRALDQGSLPGTTTLRRMAIFFQPGPAQQSDLQKLLAEQQDPSSPNYHKWLTPEEYGMRFGMHPDDLATVARWLQAQGFRNISTARSRTYIEFD